MKKSLFLLLAAAAVVVALYLLYSQGSLRAMGFYAEPTAVKSAAIEAPDPIEAVVASKNVNAAGRLVPAQYMDLSFKSNGPVATLLVKEGQKVEKDQVLAQLGDITKCQLDISQAKLDLLNAQKTLDDLYKNASLTAAQAKYDITQTQNELDKAVKRRNSMEYPKGTKQDIEIAYRKYRQAEEILKEIDSYGDSTNRDEYEYYKMARKDRDAALADYKWLSTPYTPKEKGDQDAIVVLDREKLASAQQKYQTYSVGPDSQEIIIALARLQVAKDQLAYNEMQKSYLELSAPFSGTVTKLSVNEGSMITAGQTILTLADISRWHIETEDLTELNVTRIYEGATANVKIDALPDTTFTGKVISIKNYGESKKGDITYTATIEIENTDPRLRWNMTSPITIATE